MILQQLSDAVGVSGDEADVRQVLIPAIQDHVSDLEVDALGNLTALQAGTTVPDYRVMIAAHMDEVGLMVTAVDSGGLIQFTNVGGIDARILPGKRVLVGADKTPGVVMWKPIHKWRDMKTVAIDSLRIDTGVKDKNAAQPGDRISFVGDFRMLSDDVARGKAFDDRAGCSILVDILKAGPYPVTVAAAFTAQEEIGLRGAMTAANRLRPDAAIVLEGTTAHDVPQPNLEIEAGDLRANPGCKMGAGVVLTLADARMISDPRVLDFLRRLADENGIPWQYKTISGGGTDGGAIHSAQSGIPTMTLSLPCRYIHTPNALLNLGDYQAALALSKAVLNAIEPATFAR